MLHINPFMANLIAGSNKTYFGPHVNCPIFLYDFNQVWKFSTDYHTFRISNFTKIRPGRAELIHADWRKDIIIIIIIINCNWFVTRCQWLFYMYTQYEAGYY